MDFMSQVFSEATVSFTGEWVDDNFTLIAGAVFLVELIRYAVKKNLSWNMLGDSLANLTTLVFMLFTLLFVGLAYVAGFVYLYENFSLTQLPNTGWTILGCLILADLAYYWEHRFLHSNGLAWGTHSVHHSSPFFNISVAYRFGPLDWFFPFFFHIPLVLLGFNLLSS
ncbi:C-5 sterol desaturase [Vibrio astriarenae]|nr:C-5 sterol desaturase [Vibrio sp. C7]